MWYLCSDKFKCSIIINVVTVIRNYCLFMCYARSCKICSFTQIFCRFNSFGLLIITLFLFMFTYSSIQKQASEVFYEKWCFPVNFAKFLKTTFLRTTSGQLLLSVNLKIALILFLFSVLFCSFFLFYT